MSIWLPLELILIWCNSATLCSVFPVVGGALGGLLSAFGLMKIKSASSVLKKVLIGLAMTAAAMVTAYVLAIVMILLLY